jgi:hypothetical protein
MRTGERPVTLLSAPPAWPPYRYNSHVNEEQRSEAVARFRLTVQMAEFGIGMMFARLRREHPEESDDEIRERLRSYLHNRPPDAPGRIVQFPRR